MPFFRSFISKVCQKNKVSEGINKKSPLVAEAAKALLSDYQTDKELTAFTLLDSEDFYEAE